jgi:hypothetical protein
VLFGYKFAVAKMYKHFKKFIKYGILVVLIILAFPKFEMLLTVLKLDQVALNLHKYSLIKNFLDDIESCMTITMILIYEYVGVKKAADLEKKFKKL